MAPGTKSRFCGRTRLDAPLEAEYLHYRAPLRDLSLNGAFIDADLPLHVGQQIPLTLWLDSQHSIDVEAVVRRAGPGLGVEFVRMTPSDATCLREYLMAVRAAHGQVA